MHSPSPAFGDLFELRASLRYVEPTIWRALRVPGDISLGVLHEVLQIAFGWKNCHLHDFQVGDIRFGMMDIDDELFAVYENAAPLGAVAREGSKLVYRYDFGDDWEHDVVVERVTHDGDNTIRCTGALARAHRRTAAVRLAMLACSRFWRTQKTKSTRK